MQKAYKSLKLEEMSFLSRSPSSSPPFPIYLLPSIPFHCRRSRNKKKPFRTAESPNSPSDPPTIEPFHSEPYLGGHKSQLRCARCATDLCSSSQIISKGFTGRHGRAYLVSAPPPEKGGIASLSSLGSKSSSLPNTFTHQAVPRQLVTGAHTVSDVSCAFCEAVIGWKYDAAEEESQRYKVGKFILETKKIYLASCWEGEEWEDDRCSPSPLAPSTAAKERRERDRSVEFDSQDEDECEDLFAGVWSPGLARKRRLGRRFGRVVAGMSGER